MADTVPNFLYYGGNLLVLEQHVADFLAKTTELKYPSIGVAPPA